MADEAPKVYTWTDMDFLFAQAVDSGIWACLTRAWLTRHDERESNKWFMQADKLEQKYRTQMKEKTGFGYHYTTVLDQCRKERGIKVNLVVTPECETLFANKPPTNKDRYVAHEDE